MKRYKPKVKDFHEQALLILVQQKQDEKFTRYEKAILLERYLSENVSLKELSKKLSRSNDDFQKQILWDAINAKLLVEKDNSQIIRAYHLMEQMPIDNLAQLTQKAENPNVKTQAQKICRQKELELEIELDLETIDYEKYEQDNVTFEVENKTPSRKKSRINKERQFDLSITTRRFLQDYFGIQCLQEKRLTHEEMEQIIRTKGQEPPKRVRLQNLSYDQVATGEYILVRNETNKERNARIIPYMNPYGTSLEKLTQEIGVQYRKKG